MPRVHDVVSCLRMVRLISNGDGFVELMQNHVRPSVLPGLFRKETKCWNIGLLLR
jgi:hypothetical protein